MDKNKQYRRSRKTYVMSSRMSSLILHSGQLRFFPEPPARSPGSVVPSLDSVAPTPTTITIRIIKHGVIRPKMWELVCLWMVILSFVECYKWQFEELLCTATETVWNTHQNSEFKLNIDCYSIFEWTSSVIYNCQNLKWNDVYSEI